VESSLFFCRLFANINKGLYSDADEYTKEQVDEHLVELQQELMCLVRLIAQTDHDDGKYDQEYGRLADEVERYRRWRKKVFDDEAHESRN
jgi:hypothetical protein